MEAAARESVHNLVATNTKLLSELKHALGRLSEAVVGPRPTVADVPQPVSPVNSLLSHHHEQAADIRMCLQLVENLSSDLGAIPRSGVSEPRIAYRP